MRQFFILILFIFGVLKSSAQPVDWPSLGFTQVTTNTFNSPIRIAQAGDSSGRLFIAEQAGRIWIIQSNNVVTPAFLDLTAGTNVLQLLSIAFPPGYVTNNHFYVSYIRSQDGAACISRFQVTTNVNLADTNSEQVLLMIPEPYGQYGYDVVGQIAFGSDGFLYVGSGDGGTPTNSQYTSTLLGKLLRIDVESGAYPYSVPGNNPFVGNTNYASEIWALGLGNPQTFSFDSGTGDLYLGDSGYFSQEIDHQAVSTAGGENFGWPILDGTNIFNPPAGFTNYASLTGPVFSYDYTQGSAVRGGYVYRGPNETRMNGDYFFGDFDSGLVWGLVQTGTNWQNFQISQTPYQISAFGEDEEGNLYLADSISGRIFQIQDTRQVFTPVFSPAGGTTIYTNLVTATCVTPDAIIHYTTNGIDPTELDPIVSSGGTIQVSNGFTNKIRAFRSDLNPSAVASSIFTVQVATPVFNPTQGPITNGTSIVINCATPDAVIYYTLDGSTPTTNSPIYSGSLTINGGITVNATAVASGYLNSPVQGVFYNLVQVTTPVFSPQSPITNGTSISISCSTPGAVIYYTLDGSTPTTNSPVYLSPLTINSGITVSAIGVANGFLNSEIESLFYALAPVATLVFNPPQGLIAYGTGITITSATPGAVIYYTLDGSTPTTNSPIYSAPVILNSRATLQAQGYRSDLNPSSVQGANYTLFDYEKTVVTIFAGGTAAGFSNAVAPLAAFSNPEGICIDRSGNLYVADTGNNVIRKISASGQVTTFAGTGVAGSQLGTTTNSQFSGPTSVAIDGAGNIYVADRGNCNRICKIATNGMVTAFPTTCGNGPALWQIESDPAGNVYVGSGLAVEKMTPNGTVTTIAGNFPGADSESECEFGFCPGVGVGIDASTNLYITTAGLVYKLKPGGPLVQYAGSPVNQFGAPNPGYSDGSSLLALFGDPQLIIFAIPVHYNDAVVDSATNVFVSDSTRIRKISPSGWVSTMAGMGDAGYQNGLGSLSQFNGVTGLCVDTNGNIYVVDSGNNCIREISQDTYGIGIPDWWQLAHFGHIGIDPNADPDHDGMSNYQEFWAGTDPLNASSVLAIDRTAMVNNGFTQIRWQTMAGKTYNVQCSTDLVSWSDIGNPVQGDGSIATMSDSSPISQNGQKYYRIVITVF